ncbi:alpha/beta fold hydrolase [Cellulomonas cellasea]|uniref:Alpha/beta hydrolase n=2 Tax=Cellulomonas cellasea TaxID=43670 RepID=A0A0A0B8Z3_9CELL|nr:alpha/beta hydrolase [Cellulomonas cellasea]KGM01721.1 alpha/beta hydrolase [Cellulomonas cellasea DSM 20118]GEA87004.1 hydrolase [Cellulomonas cellasea]
MSLTPHRTTPVTHHRTATIDGRTVFYREAGPAGAPVAVLLHGYPSSSAMFRDLIPRLAERYHVLAPDYVGFGHSDAPSVDDFAYTFDHLTDVVEAFLAGLGVERFAIYVHDYGAPVGWRLYLRAPERITAVVSQNGNAYEEGFVETFWAPLWRWSADGNAEDEATVREGVTAEAIRWQYTHGLADPSVVDPDTWSRDAAQVNRPGLPEVQLALFADYPGNRPLYPVLHKAFRAHPVPLLAVWGANDEIFGPDGARAFEKDLPDARIELVEGGHFLLESHLDEVATAMLTFLDEHL